jgi:long-chain acyl-CoA synthetase
VRGLRVQRRHRGIRGDVERLAEIEAAPLGLAPPAPGGPCRNREERETMTNLAGLIVDAAAADPERPAIRPDDAVVPYGALDHATRRVAGLLRAKGVGAGDRVGIMLPNVPYFPIALYGILRLGAVAVPMNPLLKEREVAFHLDDSGAKVLFAWHGFAEAAERGSDAAGAECVLVEPGKIEPLIVAAEPIDEVAERADDDTAVIVYTSGTTGTPKGAELTHHNLLDAARVAVELVDSGPDSVVLGALPLFHVFGLTSGLNSMMRAGGCLTLLPRFEPAKALEIIERDRVTILLGVPTMYTALLHAPERESVDMSTLKLCVSGGAAMPVEVLRGFDTAFGCKVLEGYGLSETCGMASFNRPDRECKPGSIGLPVEGVDMKVVDEDGAELPQGEVGEIVMRSPHVMKGYFGRADATAEVMRDGWFRTGDMAYIDEEGYLFIVDRKKDLIVRGGYNVYPREVEEVLYEHPAILEAAVIGVPHESLGEEVAAVVPLNEGAGATPDELRAYVKERVAAYKYPRYVWLVDDLPKGPTGKILKREISLPDSAPAARGS